MDKIKSSFFVQLFIFLCIGYYKHIYIYIYKATYGRGCAMICLCLYLSLQQHLQLKLHFIDHWTHISEVVHFNIRAGTNASYLEINLVLIPLPQEYQFSPHSFTTKIPIQSSFLYHKNTNLVLIPLPQEYQFSPHSFTTRIPIQSSFLYHKNTNLVLIP